MIEDNQAFSAALTVANYESIHQAGKKEYVGFSGLRMAFWGMAAWLRRPDQFGYMRSDEKPPAWENLSFCHSQSRKCPVVLNPSFSLVPSAKHWAGIA